MFQRLTFALEEVFDKVCGGRLVAEDDDRVLLGQIWGESVQEILFSSGRGRPEEVLPDMRHHTVQVRSAHLEEKNVFKKKMITHKSVITYWATKRYSSRLVTGVRRKYCGITRCRYAVLT